MVFEPDTYSESWTIMENIIVEARREFILQNRDKTAGQSGKKRVLLGPLARIVSSVLAFIWRYVAQNNLISQWSHSEWLGDITFSNTTN